MVSRSTLFLAFPSALNILQSSLTAKSLPSILTCFLSLELAPVRGLAFSPLLDGNEIGPVKGRESVTLVAVLLILPVVRQDRLMRELAPVHGRAFSPLLDGNETGGPILLAFFASGQPYFWRILSVSDSSWFKSNGDFDLLGSTEVIS